MRELMEASAGDGVRKQRQVVRRRFVQEGREVLEALCASGPKSKSAERRRAEGLQMLVDSAFLHMLPKALSMPEKARALVTFDRLMPGTLFEVAWTGSDAARVRLAEFLSRYSFSISEAEAARDPEKLGPEVLADFVEQLAANRRSRGAWYTPPGVVDYICAQTLLLWLGGMDGLVLGGDPSGLSPEVRKGVLQRLSGLRVLDPACGGGAFLVGMHRALQRTYEGLGVKQSGLAGSHLFGVDVDGAAIGVARLRLWLAEGMAETTRADEERLVRQLTVADSLGARVEEDGWDIVVTNPPYGPKATVAVRTRLFPAEGDRSQSRDVYGLFMARTLALLKPGGIAGMVVADTWRTIKSHLPLRRRLLEESRLLQVVDLPDRTFDATVGAEVLLIQKGTPPLEHRVQVSDLRQGSDARWRYPQRLCAQHPRQPVFIASSELFRLMTDTRLVRLGEIAEIRHGLTTGDTRSFIYKRAGAEGAYPVVDERKIVTPAEGVEQLSEEEKAHGFDPARFGGRSLVPYDKGGASRTKDGWLPCYAQPTDYFIDWSRESVARMKRLPGFRHDGRAYYFRPGITFSHTGFYAPTFRQGSGSVFDTAGSTIFPRCPQEQDRRLLLGLLNSRVVRYLFKNYINHSVNTAENPLKEIPLAMQSTEMEQQLRGLVERIIEQQERDRYYPFHLHEQREIDRIVYTLYGLSEAEIAEIERWYAARYPRLVTGNR